METKSVRSRVEGRCFFCMVPAAAWSSAALPAALLLAGCAFKAVGVSYDPYVRVWVDDGPQVAEGSGIGLTLASGEEGEDTRAYVAISRHESAGGATLYWRMMGVAEIGSESLLFAVSGPTQPYMTLGFGFEFVHYPEGAPKNWTGNPSLSAALGLRSKKVRPARWFLEGRGSLWVWLPGFPQWPFESVWGRGLALSAGVDFSF